MIEKEEMLLESEEDTGTQISHKELLETIQSRISSKDIEAIQDLFDDIHTYDQHKIFLDLNASERQFFYNHLSPEQIAEFFSEIDSEKQIELLSEMEPSFISKMMEEMDADDAADIIGELSTGEAVTYLAQMDKESADDIKGLLMYDENTAGSHMTQAVITVQTSDSVKEAMRKLVDAAPDAETIYTLYALDDELKLAGVISLKELILARASERIEDIMTSRVISIQFDENQEKAARLIQDYDITALPVVDQNQNLLGIITVDDVIDVIKEEAEDDFLKLAGIGEQEDNSSDFKIIPSLRIRLPWLISMVFLEGIVVFILQGMNIITSEIFGELFVSLTAASIVLVNNMSGVPGIQTAALAIVHYNNGELDEEKQEQRFFKVQAIVILLSGLAIGIAAFLVALLVNFFTIRITQGLYVVCAVSLAVGVSACLASYVSSFIALGIVLALRKRNLDPSAASGPLMSTLGDVIAALVYTIISVGILVYGFHVF